MDNQKDELVRDIREMLRRHHYTTTILRWLFQRIGEYPLSPSELQEEVTRFVAQDFEAWAKAATYQNGRDAVHAAIAAVRERLDPDDPVLDLLPEV